MKNIVNIEFYETDDMKTLLSIRDKRTLKKWCVEHNVPVKRLGKQDLYNKEDVDMQIKKMLTE